ncbi:hypothetical protein [Actinocorallia longicatena]|uniref:hypothetical protein n=1 Tax=Actinocorallia longicatena TaxID=111803 RepID=UPI0031D202BC
MEVNRRENGLSADAYTPLIDLVPELADDLLAVLREAGIAAYALPGAGDEPDPLDRVHCDLARKDEAEALLHEHILGDRIAPGANATTVETPAPPLDDDAIFAEIVAGFGDTPTDVRWPDEEDIRPEEDGDSPDDRADTTGRMPTARVVFSADKSDVEEMPEPDEDGHYEPPPPPPLPTGDPTTRLAWLCLIGGPAYILLTVLLNWEAPGWAAFLAVAAFIGGFVTLVLRMGDEPRDGDDGAVI